MGSEQGKRALIVVRLSRVTEASTSLERQEEACRKYCADKGFSVVGVAADPGVSAAVGPFDRPDLKKWFATPEAFDVIVVYRMDRLVRRMMDLAAVLNWADANQITLDSATEDFNAIGGSLGHVMATMITAVAEMELEAISTRNASASTHNIRKGKWRGGIPPWGYVPERDEEGAWRLVQDPVQVAVIHEVVRRVLPPKREPLRVIAHDLTRRGVLTPKDRFAQVRGRKTAGYAWHSGPLKRGLISPTLLGQIVTRDPILKQDGSPLRDAQGNRVLGDEFVVTDEAGAPVIRAKPIVDTTTFRRVAAELATRENRREPTVRSNSLLRQVLKCAVCGRPAYRLKGGTGRRPRYRCASAQYRETCGNRTVDLAWADEQVEQKVLDALGPMELTQRVWEPGNDVSEELDDVGERLDHMTGLLGAQKPGTRQAERLAAAVDALAEQEEKLRAQKVVLPHWRYEPTGQTVAQWWEGAGPEERGSWLREHGVTATWQSHTEGGRVNDKGKTVGGRTVLDSFVVDLGEPDLDAADLPEPIAEQARLVREGWAAEHGGPAIATALAQAWWKEGREDPAAVAERLLDEQHGKK